MGLFGNGKSKWIKEEHLVGKPTYRCSKCQKSFEKVSDRCPGCKSEMDVSRLKRSPVWVDEMADDWDLE